MKRPQSYIIENGIPHCYCSRCAQYHECSEFHRDRRTPNGYAYNCRATCKEYSKNFSNHNETKHENTIEGNNLILKALGYDPNSSIPIHEQFLIKHDL